MSETTTERARPVPPGFRTPEQEQADKGADFAPACELLIEDVNPANPHLFRENRWSEYFERLRREDPVHLNEIETAGGYWSITKYDDIKAVSSDWQTFSSAHGMTRSGRPCSPRSHLATWSISSRSSGSGRVKCSTRCPKARPSTGSTRCRSS